MIPKALTAEIKRKSSFTIKINEDELKAIVKCIRAVTSEEGGTLEEEAFLNRFCNLLTDAAN